MEQETSSEVGSKIAASSRVLRTSRSLQRVLQLVSAGWDSTVLQPQFQIFKSIANTSLLYFPKLKPQTSWLQNGKLCLKCEAKSVSLLPLSHRQQFKSQFFKIVRSAYYRLKTIFEESGRILTRVGTFAVSKNSRHGEKTCKYFEWVIKRVYPKFAVRLLILLTSTLFSVLSALVSNLTTFFNKILTCFPSRDFTLSAKII